MILLLGGSGYVGTAFQQYLCEQSIPFRSVSRKAHDYTNRETLVALIREASPSFLINAAGFTGKPNVDACEWQKPECLAGNSVLPGTIRSACEMTQIPWGHVSSGCIFSGTPDDHDGFRESDTPNFTFRTNNCSFYSGTKALGEECLDGCDSVYIWRLRIPFNHQDSARNYLSKVMRYERLLDARNSISQLNEFVRTAIHLWERRCPFGTYHVTNPGSITTREIVDLIQQHLRVKKNFQFFASESEFMQVAAKTPRSNCVLDTSKLQSTGIQLTPVHDAVERALKEWREASSERRVASSE